MKHRASIIMGIIICVVGLIFIIPGYYKTVKPVNDAVKKSGTAYGVVSPDTVKSGYITDDSQMVEYSVQGEAFSTWVSRKGRIIRFKHGERLKVYYDPERPSEAMPAGFMMLYNRALALALFVIPLYLFGFSLIALGILKRDSFFDISGLLAKGIPSSVKKSTKIVSGTCAALWLLKITTDIPAMFNTLPYMLITLAAAIVINVTLLVVLLKIENGKKRMKA